MNVTLYELSEDYRQALQILADPELPPEAVADTLEGMIGTLEDKATNIAMFFRNLEATAAAIKEAEETMTKRRKALETRVSWLKGYLKDNMERCGIQKVESPWFVLSIQKNPAAVDILDEGSLPDEFVEIVTTRKVDKTSIKKAIEAGEEVPGAVLTRGTRLSIR